VLCGIALRHAVPLPCLIQEEYWETLLFRDGGMSPRREDARKVAWATGLVSVVPELSFATLQIHELRTWAYGVCLCDVLYIKETCQYVGVSETEHHIQVST
jgi:hypothetical protein